LTGGSCPFCGRFGSCKNTDLHGRGGLFSRPVFELRMGCGAPGKSQGLLWIA